MTYQDYTTYIGKTVARLTFTAYDPLAKTMYFEVNDSLYFIYKSEDHFIVEMRHKVAIHDFKDQLNTVIDLDNYKEIINKNILAITVNLTFKKK